LSYVATMEEEEEPYTLDEATYEAFLAARHRETADEAESRRAEGLGRAMERFWPVSARVRDAHGLVLPKHAAVYWAFYASLSPLEHEAYEALALHPPGGITDYFREKGLDARMVDGLDERLCIRFRCDPPELVTVLLGGSDGEHFGLFYDDPRHTPSGVVVNYARDSAETWWSAPTVLDVIVDQLEALEEYLTPEYYEDVPLAACRVRLVQEAAAAFAETDADASAEDEEKAILPYSTRTAIPQIISGVGVVDDRGRPGELPYLRPDPHTASKSLRDPARVGEWIDAARVALDRGEPLYALALGRDLHWFDVDAHRAASLDLLTRAYRALGREALARIAEVHHAHRDLTMVATFAGSW
jgi:hypothetical protein